MFIESVSKVWKRFRAKHGGGFQGIYQKTFAVQHINHWKKHMTDQTMITVVFSFDFTTYSSLDTLLTIILQCFVPFWALKRYIEFEHWLIC